MGQYFLATIFWIFRLLLSLRYRVKVKGLDLIAGKGFLFCPNHPAEVDPLILIAILWKRYKPHPLVIEHFYYHKGLRFFMELVRALPLPSMEIGNQWKVRQVEKLKDNIHKQLLEGENFLIYPAGRLMQQPLEKIGGASLIADLLKDRADINIVLIRTTGLWGSTFSRALTGMSPDFGKTLFHGLKVLLKNGMFFTPKRKIEVEIAPAPVDFPRHGEKMEINQYLEHWYNQKGPEPLQLVSLTFWRKTFPKHTPFPTADSTDEAIEVPEERRAQILGHLSKMTHRPFSDFKPKVHLFNDLGLDSLDVSQIQVFLQERFDITGIAPGQLQTVQDVMQAAAGVVKESAATVGKTMTSKWPQENKRHSIRIPDADNIPEAFLRSCLRGANLAACADGWMGAVSYNKLKRMALILALALEKMPGRYIGILFPSSIGAYVTVFATMLAGKIPVMLNWTTGYRNLEHAQKLFDLQVVLSSFRFLSRLEYVDLGKVDDRLVLLENLRRTIRLRTKWQGVLRSFRSPSSLLKQLPRQPQPDDTALVLFTSGTEALPKAVPLTHRNILSNERSALEVSDISESDILYGVLPPFHSFGLSVTGILPLMAGVRVFYAPDPTDSRSMASDIEHWKPTIFCCAPSFVSSLLRLATAQQLASLRLVVMGAEKAPEELFYTLQAKGKIALEGYGISECSPTVTLERKGEPHRGVGRPLPGIELMIIDPETGDIFENGEAGEVCIHGPSVFKGYIGTDRDPFIKRKGKLWYRSGDRGQIEPDGTLVLTGRFKRFVKMGSEMISLGGLEEDLHNLCTKQGLISPKTQGIALAVIATGRESDKPQLVLFSTFSVDRDHINRALKEMGHGRLIKIAEVRPVKEIPCTAIGKTDYRMLEEML